MQPPRPQRLQRPLPLLPPLPLPPLRPPAAAPGLFPRQSPRYMSNRRVTLLYANPAAGIGRRPSSRLIVGLVHTNRATTPPAAAAGPSSPQSPPQALPSPPSAAAPPGRCGGVEIYYMCARVWEWMYALWIYALLNEVIRVLHPRVRRQIAGVCGGAAAWRRGAPSWCNGFSPPAGAPRTRRRRP